MFYHEKDSQQHFYSYAYNNTRNKILGKRTEENIEIFRKLDIGLKLKTIPYLKNTTKWNMSGPVCLPRACVPVANDISKTA